MPTVERPLRKDAERNRQRILDAAQELFTERGLGVTLNDIAHHADVGVGTVYRRFPDKQRLIDALFDERIGEMVSLAEESLADPDPWEGLVGFLERGLDLQACNRGLKELLQDAPEGLQLVESARDRLVPLVSALVERARDAGTLRADVQHEDLPLIQLMIGEIIDRTRHVDPELWRRYLEITLRGLRAHPDPTEPLSIPAPDVDQLDRVLRTPPPPRRR
jgi:AcrR family transcriptional regulator